MASINQMFVTMLNEGIKASQAISDPEKKAMACAAIANAIAVSGLASVSEVPAVEPTVEEKKESLKEKAKPKQPKAAPAKPAVVEEEVSEEEVMEEPAATETEELTDEWTEAAMEVLAEELEQVGSLREEYDEESLDSCVQNFSDGVLKTIEDITPLNIRGFISYMQMLIADIGEEA